MGLRWQLRLSVNGTQTCSRRPLRALFSAWTGCRKVMARLGGTARLLSDHTFWACAWGTARLAGLTHPLTPFTASNPRAALSPTMSYQHLLLRKLVIMLTIKKSCLKRIRPSMARYT